MIAIQEQQTLIFACYEAEIIHRHDQVKVVDLRRFRTFVRCYNFYKPEDLRKIYNFGGANFRGVYHLFPVRTKSDTDFCDAVPIHYFRAALESLKDDWMKRTGAKRADA